MYNLFYYGIVRTNRAIALSFILPEQPIKAIALSESISVLEPILNYNIRNQILGLLLAMMYAPQFTSYILDIYTQKNLINIQGEICILLLFISYNTVQYIN